MTLSEKDKQTLWHPYTQHKTAPLFPAIVRAKGVLLFDEHNNEYIDGISSWWANPFGHGNTQIAEAIYHQLLTLDHVLFGGFTHQPAVELAEKLLEILPSNQSKIFFSDNGSTAVEIALKACLQYFFNKNEPKTTLIAFDDAFHGDTFGAMAVSGIGLFTEAFKNQLLEVVRVPIPTAGNEQKTLEAFQEIIQQKKCAAFIFEPLVLGAAGMQMYSPKMLDRLLEICKQNNIFTIADEVMTGFGKTGKTFASDFLAHKPDVICLSKALTGGTIPMAATSFSQEIFDGFFSDDTSKALFHGHTFTANPTGCAAALASIKILQTPEMQENITQINQKHLRFEKHIKNHKNVKTTRVLGIIFALEVKTTTAETYYGTLRNKMYDFCIQKGVVLRPIGNIVYIMPSYTIEKEQLTEIYQTVEALLNWVYETE